MAEIDLGSLEQFGVWSEYEQLIRAAVDASDAFDAHDPCGDPDDPEMFRLNQEAFQSNVALVEFALEHGTDLLMSWKGERRAA